MVQIYITPANDRGTESYEVRTTCSYKLTARIEKQDDVWYAWDISVGPFDFDTNGDALPYESRSDAVRATEDYYEPRFCCVGCGQLWSTRECPPCAIRHAVGEYADDRITGTYADLLEYGQSQ